MSLNISPHKITDTPCRGGIVFASNDTHKYYARVQNACLQEYESGGALFESCFPLQNPI